MRGSAKIHVTTSRDLLYLLSNDVIAIILFRNLDLLIEDKTFETLISQKG